MSLNVSSRASFLLRYREYLNLPRVSQYLKKPISQLASLISQLALKFPISQKPNISTCLANISNKMKTCFCLPIRSVHFLCAACCNNKTKNYSDAGPNPALSNVAPVPLVRKVLLNFPSPYHDNPGRRPVFIQAPRYPAPAL